jgi:hypothetical protein
MAYDPTKPVATDTPAYDVSIMQTNFAALKTLIDVNHVTFDITGQGKHPFVQFPPTTGSVPKTEVDEYALFGTATGLYIRKPNTPAGVPATTTDINLTAPGGQTTTGWYMLPGGIIMKWGSGTITGVNRNTATGTAVLASGAGVPTITTLLSKMVCASGSTTDVVITYYGFDEAGHTVTASGWRDTSTTTTGYFSYLLMGI